MKAFFLRKYDPKRITLFILYCGYFLDFYDLSVFAIGYNEILRDQFHLTSPLIIQQTRILMTNYQIAGILLGCLLFGLSGDRLGRVFSVRYSILIYSFATLMGVFTTSLALFTFFRFLSGFGLACEFSTTNVLIAELLPQKDRVKSCTNLYIFGVFGGLLATFFGFFSWKLMFIFGGGAGFVLYFFRAKLIESNLFELCKLNNEVSFRKIFKKLCHYNTFLKLIIYTVLITPFNFVTAVFFLLPKFMNITYPFEISTKIILFTFYIGNIISALFANYFVNKFQSYKLFLILNIFLFFILIPMNSFMNNYTVFIYGTALGFIAGGYPVIWIQFSLKKFDTVVRNTTSNLLFSFGRLTSIGFNIILIRWLLDKASFANHIFLLVSVIFLSCFFILMLSKDTFHNDLFLSAKKS